MKSKFFESLRPNWRSLPNTKTFNRYFDAFVLYLATLSFYNFVAICLIYDDFMPRVPWFFTAAIPMIIYNIYTQLEVEFKNLDRDKMKDAIIFIRLRQTQSLREMIEENPEVLKGRYDQHSLFYWAKRHNNLQAHALMVNVLKKNINSRSG